LLKNILTPLHCPFPNYIYNIVSEAINQNNRGKTCLCKINLGILQIRKCKKHFLEFTQFATKNINNMKNIILSVIATLFSLTAIGQVPQYYDSWMFPEVVNQGCISIPLSMSDGLSHVCGISEYLDVTAYAQPYFTDSIISIKGIAILGSWGVNPDTSYKFYLQIRDSSLNNVLAQVRYDTIPYSFPTTPPWNTGGNGFKKVLFDSSIFINSNKFYAVITSREVNSPPFYFSTNILEFTLFPDSCTTTENPKWFMNNKWDEIIDPNIHEPPAAITIFPILDTLTYQGINELSNVNSDVDISIYPNPAENEITFSSSVEIKKIEILNLLGQIIYTKDMKSTNTKINISNLAKGNYIAKIYTDNGVATKKFIVE